MKLSFFLCYQDQLKLEIVQQQYLLLIIRYFYANVDFVFIFRLFRWIFLCDIHLTLYHIF